MSEADFQRIGHEVLALSFAVAIAFGFLAQRVRFCTMGAVTDLVVTGDWTRMRMWLVAVGTSIIK